MGRIALVLAALVAGACGRIGFDFGNDDGGGADAAPDGAIPVDRLAPGWTQHFPGTTGAAHLHDLVIRADRTIVAAGHFEGSIDIGFGAVPAVGAGDLVITGRGTDGKALWGYYPGGSGKEDPLGLAADAAGNVYVSGGFVGEMQPSGPVTFTAADGFDGFLIATDPDGTYRWGVRLGDAGDDYVLGLAASGPTVMIAGMFAAKVDFGVGTLVTATPDVFVARYQGDGMATAARKAGGAGPQGRTDVVALPDGGFAVTGKTIGPIDLGTGPLGAPPDADLFVAVYEADGSARWARRYPHAGAQSSAALAVGPDGALYVVGTTDAGIDFGVAMPAAGAGGDDVFLLKLTPGGDPVWARMIAAASGNEFPGEPAVLADGSVLVVGQFSGSGTVGDRSVTSAGLADLFVVQVALDGHPAWVLTAGSDRDDALFGAAADPAGGAVVGGHFGGAITIGSSTLTAVGYSDMFLLRLDATSP